jgi:hypothetical protein
MSQSVALLVSGQTTTGQSVPSETARSKWMGGAVHLDF